VSTVSDHSPSEQQPHPSGVGRRTFLTLAGGAVATGAAGVAAATPVAAGTPEVAEQAGAQGAAPAAAAGPPPAQHPDGEPDFGPNVYVFDGSTPASTIQSVADAVYAQQAGAEFGTGRYALLFKPGGYGVDLNIGYYTQAAGLGLQPSGASITNAVHTDADAHGHGALTNFWRGVENLNIVPRSGSTRVFVPAVRTDTHGTSWEGRRPEGTSVPIGRFHLAKPAESAAVRRTRPPTWRCWPRIRTDRHPPRPATTDRCRDC
jgi:hypothetical protein